jgi:hypothetical protein
MASELITQAARMLMRVVPTVLLTNTYGEERLGRIIGKSSDWHGSRYAITTGANDMAVTIQTPARLIRVPRMLHTSTYGSCCLGGLKSAS